MNWSDLSMSQRSELMSIYLKNGITSLDEMKKHYNSFAEGGSPDDPPNTGSVPETPIFGGTLPEVNVKPYTYGDSWFNYWYSNRREQLANNIESNTWKPINWLFPNRGNKLADKYINSIPEKINRIEEHYYDDITNASDKYKQWLIDDANFELGYDADRTPEKAARKLAIWGSQTSPVNHFILYGFSGDKGTGVHEATHDMGPVAPLQLITNYRKYNGLTGKYKKPINAEGVEFDSYLDTSQEIRSRLNAMRYMLDIDPKHVWTIEEIRALKNHPDYTPNELDLDRYNDDFLLYLFNEIANNNTPTITNYAAKGGKLDIPPYWGQPTNKKDSPIDYLSRYVNSQAFARRAPNQSYIKQAKNAVNNFNGVTNSQWREYSIGPHINEYNNTITMYPGRIDTPYAPYEYSFEAPYMAILAHEYGHLIDPNYGKENNVPKSYTDLYKTIIPEANSHDSRPDEIYADLQSLRYQLYENNIFDVINDGVFNESHLDKALKQGVPNRLLYTMPKEAIIQMMNTIADNRSQDAIANIVADGGKIHIKPENRGKFTALKKRTGHSASWFKENGTPAQKKMAVFELNSKKWGK